jgi:cellulose synthase/poly-beta-1,6-N-acetylglucosamine synthase-like glycosyltransferase
MLKLLFWVSIGLVLYVYLGYPVLVDLLSRLRRAPHDYCPGQPEWPSVTVIIPAHNEERWIACKTENALALDYPTDRLQILVASDGCTDKTVEIARRYAERGVEVNHRSERSGKIATLNRVIPKVHGDIVLITDCDALLGSDTLQILVRHFQDPKVGCVTGQKVCFPTESSASEGEGLYWRYEAWIKRSESRLYSCLGGNGQILTARRCLATQMPETSDDFYIPMRILISTGKRVVFEPRAKAQIPAAATLAQELERKIRTHRSSLRNLYYLREGLKPWKSAIWWQFWSHHALRLFVPYALLTALLFSAFLWRASALYRVTAIGQCMFYVAAATGCVLTRWGLRPRIFYIPFYFVFANLGVLLAWVRWARVKQPYVWQRTKRMLPAVEPLNHPRS